MEENYLKSQLPCNRIMMKVERAGSVCSDDAPSSPESVTSGDTSPLSSPQPSPAPITTDPYDDHRLYSPAYSSPMSPSGESPSSPSYSYTSSPLCHHQSPGSPDPYNTFQFPPQLGYESDDAYCYQAEFSRAVRDGNPRELKKILSRYPQLVQINGFNGDGQTALTQSCMDGNLEVIKVLVAHGASLTLTNRDGFSPIHLACWCGKFDIMQYLLSINRR